MKEFLLSDESLNSYGLIIRTSGIRLDRFLKNPVMYYGHDRNLGVAGRWENLRFSDNKLYGLPVFDDIHEPGKSTKEKVESGFLKGASIGIEECKIEIIRGVKTVVNCSLVEVSICDIPSNENALQLYHNDIPMNLSAYLQLSINQKTMNEQELNSVLQALNLPDGSNVADILAAIANLKTLSQAESSIKETLCLAYKEGVIAQGEVLELEEAFSKNPLRLSKYLESRRSEQQKVISKKFDDFVNSHPKKFRTYSFEFIHGDMKALALKDFDAFSSMMEKAPELMLPLDLIRLGNENNRLALKANWTLDDYRKHAPQELQKNPTLYKELLEKENQCK